MNIYALFPLIATIAYIPLLVTTLSSRPWQRRHTLFVLFLTFAVIWSFLDIFFRSDFFPQYSLIIGKLIIIAFSLMAVQFHCFTSSFFAPGQGRWLPFAYASLAAIIALVVLGGDLVVSGDKLNPVYGRGIVFVAIPLTTLAARNLYVFWKRLKFLDNPVLYNQIISMMFGYFVLIVFTLASFIPWVKEFPISHFGNLINAFILSYAVVRHQLVDVRVILRRGFAWVSLGIIGIGIYGFLLFIFHSLFGFELDFTTAFSATFLSLVVSVFVYKLRNFFLITMGKAFQGPEYDYRQELSDFASKIHNVFTLQEQGGELLTLVSRAIGCKRAGLLFLEAGSEDFVVQLVEPAGKDNPLSSLRLRGQSPIVEYLGRERKMLTKENLSIMPEFLSLWGEEKGEIKSCEIDLFMPLISRDRLIGILALGKKRAGRYSLQDFNLLEDVIGRVAVSMEKEYLRELLKEREEELSVINRSSAVITSSLDIQEIYDSFIEELKGVVDVSWAAISLVEENDVYVLALSSEIGSAWQVGERIPIKGTATAWVAAHRETLVEPDLAQENRFTMGKYHFKQGVRSIAYLPLVARGKAIGTLVVASCRPNAYSQRQIKLLEQLASQIAMPVENSRLYAEVEEKARLDELTGLLNRRSLDELIVSEIGRHSRYGGVFSVIILDLDSFKIYNDSYGHLAGDKLLKKIGSIMKNTIRSADQAFRYGGDEFAILLPQTTIDAAYEVAERVRQRIASAVEVGRIPVTASLGLASWPGDGMGSDKIIEAADGALYSAKRGGGNQTCRTLGAMLP